MSDHSKKAAKVVISKAAAEPSVVTSNDEMVTVRDAMRELNRMVDRLQSGEVEKFVLMKHNRMVAAVVPLAEVTA